MRSQRGKAVFSGAVRVGHKELVLLQKLFLTVKIKKNDFLQKIINSVKGNNLFD